MLKHLHDDFLILGCGINNLNFFAQQPPTLSSLRGLEDLTLSRNNLTGLIPKDLEKLSTLGRLNLSFNNLEGDVPRGGVFKNVSDISVVGNSKLCGGIPQLHLPECPKKVFKEHKKSLSFKFIALIVVGIVLLMFIVSATLILYWIQKSRRKPSAKFMFGDRSLEMVSYNEILKATDGSSSPNLLGVGSFVSVYKAIFHEDEKHVARSEEYGMGSKVSTQGDVYSYGIVLLEMFTGRRPTADMFKDGVSLHGFSKMALLSDKILEIVDARLFLEGEDDDEASNATMENVRL